MPWSQEGALPQLLHFPPDWSEENDREYSLNPVFWSFCISRAIFSLWAAQKSINVSVDADVKICFVCYDLKAGKMAIIYGIKTRDDDKILLISEMRSDNSQLQILQRKCRGSFSEVEPMHREFSSVLFLGGAMNSDLSICTKVWKGKNSHHVPCFGTFLTCCLWILRGDINVIKPTIVEMF